MSSGAHAFDFIYGRWTVHNRKLRDVTDPACEEWVDFDATIFTFSGTVPLNHSQVIHNTPDNCDPPGAVPGCTG